MRKPSTTPALRHVTGIIVVATLGALGATPSAQQATFRSSVDLIAVDTQVTDHNGAPIGTLTAKDFQVWINGHPRKVVSADLVEYPLARPLSFAATDSNRPSWITGELPTVTGRLFILAIDELSFTTPSLQRAAAAVKTFINRLKPEDIVGVYPYPLGFQSLDLSHLHSVTSKLLDHVTAMNEPFIGDFQLSPSEIVDLTARDSVAMTQVISRECPSKDPNTPKFVDGLESINPNNLVDASCPARLLSEANARSTYEESQTTQSFLGLRELLQSLTPLPGPKTVVLISAGMLSSDRVGGHPDVMSVVKTIGADAAAADVTLYVMHFDDHFQDTYSAAAATPHRADDLFLSEARDSNTLALGLQHVAGEAGGEYLRIAGGMIEPAFTRVLSETSAYYLLGVEPEAADRDGRAHTIRVAANAKGATVRNRQQVTVPKGS